jgi:YVTN family beta-propeller protein
MPCKINAVVWKWHAGGPRGIALGIFVLATLVAGLAPPVACARDAYVANEGAGTVQVIDLATGSVVGDPIPVGAGSGALAITPDGRKAYVANHGADTVSVIDTETNETVGGGIAVGEGPRGVAISPDGTRVYVANEKSGTVSVIDTGSDEVVDTIDPVIGARGLAVSPDSRHLYVGHNATNTVSVIDTGTEEEVGVPIVVGANPQGIAFTPDGKKAYVANLFSKSVSVIDTATRTVIETIEVGNNPVGIAITPNGERAYVANTGSDTVSVIDTGSDETLGEPIEEVGEGPRGVTIAPDGKRTYVASGYFPSHSSDTFLTIDTGSDELLPGGSIEVGSEPLGVAIVPDQAPLASLASATGTAGQSVQLDASTSGDPDGQIARYDWDFGDGQETLDAGPTPTHIYSDAGTYQATVTLTDSEGCSTKFVFTGATASCNGSLVATATSTVQVAKPPEGGPEPPAVIPSNVFLIGKLDRDRRKGVARLKISVPGPGTLQLNGKRVRAVQRTVEEAGTVTLTVRPKPKAMEALKYRGRLKVGAIVTFTPNGAAARALTKKLTLVREG